MKTELKCIPHYLSLNYFCSEWLISEGVFKLLIWVMLANNPLAHSVTLLWNEKLNIPCACKLLKWKRIMLKTSWPVLYQASMRRFWWRTSTRPTSLSCSWSGRRAVSTRWRTPSSDTVTAPPPLASLRSMWVCALDN